MKFNFSLLSLLFFLFFLFFSANALGQCTALYCPNPSLDATQLSTTTYNATWSGQDDVCYYFFALKIWSCDGDYVELSDADRYYPVSDGDPSNNNFEHELDISEWLYFPESEISQVQIGIYAYCRRYGGNVFSSLSNLVTFTDFDPICCTGPITLEDDCHSNPNYQTSDQLKITVECDGSYEIEVVGNNVMMIKLFDDSLLEEFYCSPWVGCDYQGSCDECLMGSVYTGVLPNTSEDLYFQVQYLDYPNAIEKECKMFPNASGKRSNGTILSDSQHSPDFNIFPNPAQNHIALQNIESSPYEINIVSSSGQTVQTDKINGMSQKEMDISHLSNGTYFIQFTNAETQQRSFEKIVILK